VIKNILEEKSHKRDEVMKRRQLQLEAKQEHERIIALQPKLGEHYRLILKMILSSR